MTQSMKQAILLEQTLKGQLDEFEPQYEEANDAFNKMMDARDRLDSLKKQGLSSERLESEIKELEVVAYKWYDVDDGIEISYWKTVDKLKEATRNRKMLEKAMSPE